MFSFTLHVTQGGSRLAVGLPCVAKRQNRTPRANKQNYFRIFGPKTGLDSILAKEVPLPPQLSGDHTQTAKFNMVHFRLPKNLQFKIE